MNHNEASKSLLWYLFNSGKPFGFDGPKMLKEDYIARKSLAILIEEIVKAVKRDSNAPSFGSNSENKNEWVFCNSPYDLTTKNAPHSTGGSSDWQHAVGAYYVKGSVKYTCIDGIKNMDLRLIMGDRYNFHHNDLDVSIFGITVVKDAELAELHAHGLAKAYHREGGELNVSISNYDDYTIADYLKVIESNLGVSGASGGGDSQRRPSGR